MADLAREVAAALLALTLAGCAEEAERNAAATPPPEPMPTEAELARDAALANAAAESEAESVAYGNRSPANELGGPAPGPR